MNVMKIDIKGMHCRSCELLLGEKIGAVQGVKSVAVSYRNGTAEIRHGRDVPSFKEIEAAIVEAGYEIGLAERKNWLSRNTRDYGMLVKAALVLLAIYYAARGLGLTDLSLEASTVTYPLAFVVGLVAGISTCMAMVGGLILGLSARHAEIHPEARAWEKFRPHLYFNLGRIGGYALLGGLLGSVGSVLKLSGPMLAAITIGVGALMIFLGLKLSGISPRLKDASVSLPSGIARRLGLGKHQSEYSHRGAVITGALTFFLPCGFTQAMQVFAIGSGSFSSGALIMGLFALGTAPALLTIGGLTSVIKGAAARWFYSIVGLAVLLFGILNLGNGLALVGINPASAFARSGGRGNLPEIQNGYQIVRMTQGSNGYSPSNFTVRVNVPVRWIITSTNAYTCAASIVMPSQGVSQALVAGENVIEFTPKQTGNLPFSCSMGMYRGSFTVVDQSGGGAVTAPAAAPVARTGGGCGGGGGGCGGGCGGGATTRAVAAPNEVKDSGGVQTIVSDAGVGGLKPNEFTVAAGRPVEWTINSSSPPAGCMVAFVNPELGVYVDQNYPAPTVVKFTPTTPGDYDITCPMGMLRAVAHVK